MTSLFLFAHQDDEIGVFHELELTLALGERVVCVYLTDGGGGKATPAVRDAESRAMLTALGVPASDIHALGTDIGIPDGALPDHLERCWDELTGPRAARLGDVRRIVTHAWEGGHQDHDAAHLIGVVLANRLGVLAHSRQFPLYRAPGGRFRLTFAKPLAENGPVERGAIPLKCRLRYLVRLARYRSQRGVMAKLGPRMALDYLADGNQKLQPLSLARLRERPNSAFLYEVWRIYDYARLRQNADAFLARHI